MDSNSHPDSHASGVRYDRRKFLGITGGITGGSLLAGKSVTAQQRRPLSFAVVADSHIDPTVPERTDRLDWVYSSIVDRQPGLPRFVCHVGDVVEAGLPAEYAEYETTEPPELRNRIHAVPGNHEVRWDAWAKQNFAERFGDTPYSFDAGGIHFLALDPTQLLQEPGYFDPQHRQWLENDLEQTGPETPIVAFVHYPVGADNYYIGNQDVFFELLEPYNVRAIFAGHVHQERLWHQNGIAMITLPAVRNVPVYYWVDKKTTADGKAVLDVTFIENEDGERNEREIARIPLEDDRPAESVRPTNVTSEPVDDSELELTVTVPSPEDVLRIEWQWWPEYEWAGRYIGEWESMAEDSNGSWKTTISTDEQVPEDRRIQIRAVHRDGSFWDETVYVSLPTDDRIGQANEYDLGAPVRADLTIADETDRVVATTADGGVTAFDATDADHQRVWEFRADEKAEIVGSPAVTDSGERVFVGTAEQTVYALDAATGDAVWETELADPVLGNLVAVAGESLVLVPAGHALYALDGETGDVHWERDVGGFVGGKPEVDDEAVYLGVGDGTVRSLDLETGVERWKNTITTQDSPYRTLIYSAWNAKATVLSPDVLDEDLIVISNVVSTWAFNRETGDVVWEADHTCPFSKPLVYSGEVTSIIFVNEWGTVVAVDATTGNERWAITLPQRVLDTDVILWNDTIYATGVKGTVFGLDPATGELAQQFSFSTDYAFSSPVSTDEHLFVGNQDGTLNVLDR